MISTAGSKPGRTFPGTAQAALTPSAALVLPAAVESKVVEVGVEVEVATMFLDYDSIESLETTWHPDI